MKKSPQRRKDSWWLKAGYPGWAGGNPCISWEKVVEGSPTHGGQGTVGPSQGTRHIRLRWRTTAKAAPHTLEWSMVQQEGAAKANKPQDFPSVAIHRMPPLLPTNYYSAPKSAEYDHLH